MVGCPLAAAAVVSCLVQQDRWIVLHLAVRACFECVRWSCKVIQPVRRSPLLPASWLPALDKSRGSKSVEVQRVWEVYDDPLQFMSWDDAVALDESLHACDVSRAWLVGSFAAEAALADAFRFAGGSAPDRGLVLGRGAARMRTVRLGGHHERSIRRSAADVGKGDDVHLYKDSSAVPLWIFGVDSKAVLNVLDGLIRHGVSLSRSVELLIQWDRVLRLGPLGRITLDDYFAAGCCGLVSLVCWWVSFTPGYQHSFVGWLCIVLMLQSLLGGVGFVKILLFIPFCGSNLTWCLLLLFSSVMLACLPVVLGFWLIQQGLMRNSERLGFPIFVVLGKGRPALKNSMRRLKVGCLCYLRLICPG